MSRPSSGVSSATAAAEPVGEPIVRSSALAALTDLDPQEILIEDSPVLREAIRSLETELADLDQAAATFGSSV